MIKVGIIEDNISILNNLNVFLGNFPDLQIVFSFSDLPQFEKSRSKGKLTVPDIIVIDSNVNAEYRGLDILSRFTELYPFTKLLVYTEVEEEDIIIESIIKGACGYLLKSNTLYDIYLAIKECCEHGGFISNNAVLKIINYLQHKQTGFEKQEELSVKQREITNCLQQGFTYEEISKQLGVTRFTVNYHVQRIFRKMMVKSKIELVYKLNRREEIAGLR